MITSGMKTFIDFLQVAKSTIPGAGKGLFTRIAIPAESLVAEYFGKITTWAKVQHDLDNEYLFYFSSKIVIDAKPFPDAIARYANDATGIHQIKGLENNCIYHSIRHKVFIKSFRAIPAGAEILVHYGTQYWDQRKLNVSL